MQNEAPVGHPVITNADPLYRQTLGDNLEKAAERFNAAYGEQEPALSSAGKARVFEEYLNKVTDAHKAAYGSLRACDAKHWWSSPRRPSRSSRSRPSRSPPRSPSFSTTPGRPPRRCGWTRSRGARGGAAATGGVPADPQRLGYSLEFFLTGPVQPLPRTAISTASLNSGQYPYQLDDVQRFAATLHRMVGEQQGDEALALLASCAGTSGWCGPSGTRTRAGGPDPSRGQGPLTIPQWLELLDVHEDGHQYLVGTELVPDLPTARAVLLDGVIAGAAALRVG